ncbi:auxin-responsive protein SAUR71-like [Phoenix dactylifera]|uniref:Auxin-responsive protein SAUR71-like n=1 Tax=Phoenix dactylifera TaxID=42345 RepID=A0A8B9AJF5_PHODC|nr:auxin-responsive protein SAUR71-like [Phoenix dactylifera]
MRNKKGGTRGGEGSARRVPRGCVPVLVGLEEMERFEVRTKLFKHPCITALLEMAAQEFGYEQKGILRIPCDAEHFRQVLEGLKENLGEHSLEIMGMASAVAPCP